MTQEQAFEILKLGHNVFLTGSAGSGKTFLLAKYIDFLRSKNIEVGVTASTGIAATHLEGVTIHSWSGIGIKNYLDRDDLKKITEKKYLRHKFDQTKVLIIDEISMLHYFRLDMVDQVCQTFKKNSLPFGGLQIILCGDFFQLPPVSKDKEETGFVIQSQVWQELNLKICYLDEQFRQTDNEFLRILNTIRRNEADQVTLKLLMTRHNKKVAANSVATKLYTHNIDVDVINNSELAKIKGKSKMYTMTSNGNASLVKSLKKGCLAPEQMVLKKGAAVMFVKNNFDKGYVNGTLGTVIDFDNEGYPIVITSFLKEIYVRPSSWTVREDDYVLAEISQLPLRLAWAITVHKSQGMSLDAAEIDLSKAFVSGMGYVALSRVRTLKGIRLLGINDMALTVDQNIVKLDKRFMEFSDIATQDLQAMSALNKRKAQKSFLKRIS